MSEKAISRIVIAACVICATVALVTLIVSPWPAVVTP